MDSTLRKLFLGMTIGALALSIGCATKKPKAAAESPETRKERAWDYQEVNKQIDSEKKEATDSANEHKDCQPITSGKDAAYYTNAKLGKHKAPHHDQCRPVESNRGVGDGLFENDDLSPHKIGH